MPVSDSAPASSTHLAIDPSAPGAEMDPYDVLIHAVAPRPIAFVSTLSKDGKPNLAPFSFFMAGGANPPSICFSPNTKDDGTPKDTLRNIQETGEFVVHIVNHAMGPGMSATSKQLPHGESEWPLSGFTQVPSLKVKPPRVAEAPFALECRLHQIVPHGNGGDAANYIIGEVVMFHVAPELVSDGRIDTTKVDYLARLGGAWYLRAIPDSLFTMKRPV
jgi:flavin reductase (DIM6/NTAB) family NADH-FMN oxidoreductase RutF